METAERPLRKSGRLTAGSAPAPHPGLFLAKSKRILTTAALDIPKTNRPTKGRRDHAGKDHSTKRARGREGLAARAREVLRQNDIGGWTRAASELYPHQWSWDAGFIAIGLAHLDTRRAAQECSRFSNISGRPAKCPTSSSTPRPRRRATSPASITGPAPRLLPTLRLRRPTQAACANHQLMP